MQRRAICPCKLLHKSRSPPWQRLSRRLMPPPSRSPSHSRRARRRSLLSLRSPCRMWTKPGPRRGSWRTKRLPGHPQSSHSPLLRKSSRKKRSKRLRSRLHCHSLHPSPQPKLPRLWLGQRWCAPISPRPRPLPQQSKPQRCPSHPYRRYRPKSPPPAWQKAPVIRVKSRYQSRSRRHLSRRKVPLSSLPQLPRRPSSSPKHKRCRPTRARVGCGAWAL